MSFESIARRYLANLQSEYEKAQQTGQLTRELSFHPTVNTFFQELTNYIDTSIELVFEPSGQGLSGRPDWRFHNKVTYGIYGYAEAKELDPQNTLNPTQYIEQVERYLRVGHSVILTDGLDFIFFNPATQSQRQYSLIAKPATSSHWENLNLDLRLEHQFVEFFEQPRPRRCSEEQLIREVAQRAREMSRSIRELVEAPIGSGLNAAENETIVTLHELQRIVEEHHDPSLRDEQVFADFVAQVLAFGLLYAHRVVRADEDTPEERFEKIKGFWTDAVYLDFTARLRPFRALTERLNGELESTLGELGTWYQDTAMLLAYVQLEEEQRTSPDYHKLYENFLSVFDPQTRFDFGAYYTPWQLAEYTVRLAVAIVDYEFEEQTLFDPCNKLVDPCCGTGTFIEHLLEHAEDWDSLPEIVGFEILPAPYALAHYRLTMLGQGYQRSPSVHIILTNTLSDELEEEMQAEDSPNLMQVEQCLAHELSRPPLKLVIGNPPSSDSSKQSEQVDTKIIEELLEDFRPPEEERSSRQNIQKQIQNDFMKFLRWSCQKVIESEHGVFALVLPRSFAVKPSYRYARRWLLHNFSKLWVLEVDLDARTGVRTSNLFPTMQGRLLLVGLLDVTKEASFAQVHHASVARLTRQEKLDELERERESLEHLQMFEILDMEDASSYSFLPTQSFDRETYSRFWQLYPRRKRAEPGEAYIFARHASGVKLAPSSLFVHSNRQVLLRRSLAIGDPRIEIGELKDRWYSGQRRPPSDSKFTPAVREEINRAARSSQPPIATYCYRPFLNLKALISEPVLRTLSNVAGGGTRYRPEVLSAFEVDETFGIAFTPARQDVAGDLHRFVSFCWYLPDNDLARRGNAQILCNLFPELKSRSEKQQWDPTPVNNVNPELLNIISQFTNVSNDDVVFYTYGVLCSSAFLDEFEGALFTFSDQIPRIPFPRDETLFQSVVDAGRRLANLEREYSVNELELGDYERFFDLFQEPFHLTKYELDADEEALNLFQNGRAVLTLSPIPREILGYRVSGYEVVKEWLKMHSYNYTRTEFDKDEYKKLLGLFNRVGQQIVIVGALDELIIPLLGGEVPLL